MPDEDQLAGKEVLERDQLLVFANDRVGALFPRQANAGAEAHFRASALVPGLHDARACAGDDHEARRGNLPAELERLLVLLPGRLGPGGTEHGHLAHVSVRRKELERVPQLPQRRLDDAHIAAVLHVLQQLERVLNDVRNTLLVVPSAPGSN